MILVKFKQVIQITETEYTVIFREKLFDPDSTLSEIIEWSQKYTNNNWFPEFLITKTDN